MSNGNEVSVESMGSGKRRTRQEAAAVREALANGQTIAFPTRHQWRHYTQRKP